MDNKFYQDDELEQFLQDEVKQHRMYPSDHIWKNIRTELHGNRAWPALTFISLFIITALTISTLLNNHPVSPADFQQLARVAAPGISDDNGAASTETPTAVVTGKRAASKKDYFQRIDPAQVTAETFANRSSPDNTIADAPARNTGNDYAAVPVKIGGERAAITQKTVINRKLATPDFSAVQSFMENGLPPAEAMIEENRTATATPANFTPEKEKEADQPAATENKKTDNHSNADDFLKDFSYVTNRPKPRDSKFGVQFYITPSTSYRRLSDQKVKDVIQRAATAAVQSIPPLGASTSSDVNNVVRHRPAVGLEVGFALLYNMSSKVKFKTGLQLNVRQYYIETFQSLTSDLTSLALINLNGVRTLDYYSPYNNNTGYKSTQLDNKVYQVSLPLGLQFEVMQGRHFGLTTEASVQPTFTVNTNTYLLSADYKHYMSGNDFDFIRKWNVNTSVGINLTYKSRMSSFQVGPQVRYQHLPSYSNSYPIKEYLLDYGVRIGYTRQLW